jgi:6,7-dimethyl-8-ribityllumazine synthase
MAEPRRATATASDDLKGARVLIVEARFYDDIGDALLAGATAALDAAGALYERLSVPGALEIPAAVAMAWDSGRYDAIVALGCVIRGDTIHFEIVSQESARALMDLSVAWQIPLGNGILTVNDDSQAWARARIEEGDKGGDAARAALAMLRHYNALTAPVAVKPAKAKSNKSKSAKAKSAKTKTKRANVKRR